MRIKITFDEEKRALTLRERGLDFNEAAEVFAGRNATIADERKDYGESRYITAGLVRGRLVVLVWTPRDDGRRIISMRHAHGKEETRRRRYLD
jgi:uncharacterized DUF497 family protein